ncbi:hypothetical protein [Endozoicomonas sp. 8E]|uniref:hypothetical protein n=1 Tax=Endozoicomonas sp. 8E TaxID=3035692 RepID=UPI002939001E|nr:hypothetical protein [Endozoicomonas sp. 8E]WOG25836.1 hypothetical protein P6910_14775 [Endozoicomonas sp. 8E]
MKNLLSNRCNDRVFRKPLSAGLVLLLLTLPALCQAESFKRGFVVELQQDGSSPTGSFSILQDPHTLLSTPSYLTDINDYAEAILPSEDKTDKLGYGVKTSLFDSISWQLIYATHFLVAYKLVMITSDATLRTKLYSGVPAEAFVAVGTLLQSYWNTDSPLFNPIGQLEASQDDPFVITTMMLPGHGQQQSQQKSQEPNQPSASPGQQASHSTRLLKATLTYRSGSGDGNKGPGQQKHTLGLNCHVDTCNGVCKLRQSSDSSESSEEGSLNAAETPTNHTTGTTEQGMQCARMDDLIQALHDLQPHALTSSFIKPENEPREQRRAQKKQPKRLHSTVSSLNRRRSSLFEQHHCNETVVGADGKEHRCDRVSVSASALKRHKKRFHTESQTCDEPAVGEDDQQQPCGTTLENCEALPYQTEAHRKGKQPLDTKQDDNDFNPSEESKE